MGLLIRLWVIQLFFQIVFPNGSIDPWHALGVVTDVTSEEQAIFIEGTAHTTRACRFSCTYLNKI